MSTMWHLPSNSFQAGLIRFVGAFLAVVGVMIAGISVCLLYGDELGPAHPVNAGKGIFAPMYRYWMELFILEASAMFAIMTGYYAFFGPKIGVFVNWHVLRVRLNHLQFASGVLLIAGVLIAFVTRQPMHARDAFVPIVGCLLLAPALWTSARRCRSIP